MTIQQLMKNLLHPNYVTPASAYQLGQEAVEEPGATLADCPFDDSTEESDHWRRGFRSVLAAVADAETDAYLGGAI